MYQLIQISISRGPENTRQYHPGAANLLADRPTIEKRHVESIATCLFSIVIDIGISRKTKYTPYSAIPSFVVMILPVFFPNRAL